MVALAANPASSACQLDGQQRQELALAALGGESISEMSREHDVSRKFIYQQKDRATQALQDAFAPSDDDEKVQFYLPVTKTWLRGMVLGLLLTCRGSFRGVRELLDDHFGCSFSVGTIHNIVTAAVEQARAINQAQDLSAIRYGAPDEIFQGGKPVLVGVDLQSTYCYLLRAAEHRDADTWALSLMELQEQGLELQQTEADGGNGIRAGQRMVWPDVPCDFDHFHALQETEKLATYLENRAYRLMGELEKLEHRMARAQKKGMGRKFSSLLGQARLDEAAAIALSDEVACLLKWLREDILPPRGPDYATRLVLLDWVAAELLAREPLCVHRIAPVRKLLANHRQELLEYIERLDKHLSELSQEFDVSLDSVRALWNLECLDCGSCQYGREAASLRCRLGGKFYGLQQAIVDLRAVTFRSSSWVENTNSRLRTYFFLRRQIGPEYLELLQFYLNHHRYARSAVSSRVGKSPCELLTGERHSHWLSLLGYSPFASASNN